MTIATARPAATYDPDTAAAPQRLPAARVASVDIVRGAVMVLMAIDHVRVYAGVPAGGPEPGVFFTRWVTHFCAPAFVFLAGTAAYLYGSKLGDRGALSRWLATRGAWLVLLELTAIRFFWTFGYEPAGIYLAGVIWAIGWCMLALALLVRLPVTAIAPFGVATIVLHNALGPAIGSAIPEGSTLAALWQVLYAGGPIGEGPTLFVLYSIIPWVGVMAAGYAFGRLFDMDAARRRRLMLAIGAGAVAAFVLLRAFDLYGNPRPRDAGLMGFLNTAKYPASLLFLLMTLGPTLLVMPFLENVRGHVARWLGVFGRTAFFYYLVHIPLIHAMAVMISLVRTPDDTWWLFAAHPIAPPPLPPGYRWSLALLYAVTALAVVILYFLCRRWAELKTQKSWPLLRYL